VYCHVSHPLTILQTAAAATTAATAATDDDDEGESVGNSKGEDDEDNEDLLSDMGPKKVPTAAAAAAAPKKVPAKSGNVDACADLLQGATVTKGAAKKPAFTSYLTKVQGTGSHPDPHRFRQWRSVGRIRREHHSCALVWGWDHCGVGLRGMGHITSEGGVLILLCEQAPSEGPGRQVQQGQ